MIVVDTSVWIDVLNDNDTPQAARCVGLIESGEPVALTDAVLTEVLQGLRSEREAQLVERHLRAFPILRLGGTEDFVLAAELYRTARRNGITIRKTHGLPDRRAVCANRCADPSCQRRLRPARELYAAADLRVDAGVRQPGRRAVWAARRVYAPGSSSLAGSRLSQSASCPPIEPTASPASRKALRKRSA